MVHRSVLIARAAQPRVEAPLRRFPAVALLGPRIPAETLRRFWTMLAHEQWQTINHARIAAGLAVSGQTVTRYLNLLTDLLLVRQLRPWSCNMGKRLVRSPKPDNMSNHRTGIGGNAAWEQTTKPIDLAKWSVPFHCEPRIMIIDPYQYMDRGRVQT